MKVAVTITAFLGVITFGYVAAPYVLPIIQNRNLWAAVSLIAVLLFTSGHMYNHIRKVPYVAADGKGGVSYFAGGFQNQFGLETQVVAAICKSIFAIEMSLGSMLTLQNRRRLGLCNHQSSLEGTAHCRPENPASRRPRLWRRYPRHLLFPVECLPDKEWRVSILVAAVLSSTVAWYSVVMHWKKMEK
jgi:hypothetical protein